MRALILLPITIALLYSPSLAAQTLSSGGSLSRDAASSAKKWYYGYEIANLQIKLSSDRTGIIKDIHCEPCNFNFVKITPKTEARISGVKTDLLRARERAGKEVYIEFDTDTAEVITINWSE